MAHVLPNTSKRYLLPLQLALLYCEGILIAQYVYQVPTRLHCSFVTQQRRQWAEVVGLHGSALRGIPIFCVYLATLMHTYRISRQQVGSLCVPQSPMGGEGGGSSQYLNMHSPITHH